MKVVKGILYVVAAPFVVIGVTLSTTLYILLTSKENRRLYRMIDDVALIAHGNPVAGGLLAEYYLKKILEERQEE